MKLPLSTLSVFAVLSSLAPAQSARLLVDINTQTIPTPSNPHPLLHGMQFRGQRTFTRLGKYTLFAATDQDHGEEVFISDATNAGTRLLKDINPGVLTSSPSCMQVTQDGKRAFFSAIDGLHGGELWVTDGTTPGTTLVKDLYEGGGYGNPAEMTPIGTGSVVFRARSSQTVGSQTIQTGYELFISDGTAAGTRLLKDIAPGSASSTPGYLCATRDRSKVFFSADDGTTGIELWVTDGTTAGTHLVKVLQVGSTSSHPYAPCPIGKSRILFTGDDGKVGYELWITDGTTAGTTLVKDLQPGSAQGCLTWHALPFGNQVLFQAFAPGMGFEPHITDGTALGTRPLIDTWPGTGSGGWISPHLDTAGTKIYWTSEVAKGDYRIFVTDGTPAGSRMFTPLNVGAYGTITESLGKIYFPAWGVGGSPLQGLCVSDGTLAGTKSLRPLGGEYLTRFDPTTVLYTAHDGVLGTELWKMSLGTSFEHIDINNSKQGINHSSFPAGAVRFGRYVAFAANDGLVGREVWISDGTAAGTRLLRDLYTGSQGSSVHSFAVAGDKLVFAAYTWGTGAELFVTDGTWAGTTLLKDIRPGTVPFQTTPLSSNPSGLTTIGDNVYFSANDGKTGYEPWVTDGTTAGTVLLKDLVPGPTSSTPEWFAGHGNQIVFGAYSPATGNELYFTDGTAAGTRLLRDISTGSYSSYPTYMTWCAGKVYFAATFSVQGKPVAGNELWVTDFTTAGTQLVADLEPGPNSSGPFYLSARNGKVYFGAFTSQTGHELFLSDGTRAGTRLFLDYNPGTASSYATHVSAIGSRKVYFCADVPGMGRETVITDGTSAGTRVLDINPGTADGYGYFDSYPALRPVLGSQVFLRGMQPAIGEEVFTVDNGATCEPIRSSHAHTWIQGTDPVLGTTAVIAGQTTLSNASQITLFGSAATRPFRVGNAGFAWFNLSAWFGITSLTQGNRFQMTLPVPNSPGLVGTEIVFQTLAFDRTQLGQTLELSNALQWAIGR